MPRLISHRSLAAAFALGAVSAMLGGMLWHGALSSTAFAQESGKPPVGATTLSQGALMVQQQQITNQKLGEIAGLLTQIRDMQRFPSDQKDPKARPPGQP